MEVQKSSLEDHIKDQEKRGESQLNDLKKTKEMLKEREGELSEMKYKVMEKEEEMSALHTEKENLQDEVNLEVCAQFLCLEREQLFVKI